LRQHAIPAAFDENLADAVAVQFWRGKHIVQRREKRGA